MLYAICLLRRYADADATPPVAFFSAAAMRTRGCDGEGAFITAAKRYAALRGAQEDGSNEARREGVRRAARYAMLQHMPYHVTRWRCAHVDVMLRASITRCDVDIAVRRFIAAAVMMILRYASLLHVDEETINYARYTRCRYAATLPILLAPWRASCRDSVYAARCLLLFYALFAAHTPRLCFAIAACRLRQRCAIICDADAQRVTLSEILRLRLSPDMRCARCASYYML